MPAAAAASTSPVPLGTCTERSSIVTVTSSDALISDLEAASGTGTWGACPYGRAGSRGHPFLDNGMVRVLVDRREETLQRRLAAEGAAALVDVSAELVSELDHVRRHRHRRGIAQRTEALPEDPVTDVEQQIELGVGCLTGLDCLEQLHHPARSLAAGG